MSIQASASSKLISRFKSKTGITNRIDQFSRILQVKERARTYNKQLPVFFPYRNHYTHPWIRRKFYFSSAPLHWSNYEDCKLAHFIQFPVSYEVPFIVEPNDHALTLGAKFFGDNPRKVVSSLDRISNEIFADKNFRGILVGRDGLRDQYKYYFGEDFVKKNLIEYSFPRFEVKAIKSNIYSLMQDQMREKTVFVCLASDYSIKAVDLLLKAWFSIDSSRIHLLLACPNVPACVLSTIRRNKSVTLIANAPLTDKLRNHLLSSANVSIALTHIDGGANAFEGIEYGHPVITNKYHRDGLITANRNGVVIPFVNEYYRPGEYGVRYGGMREYMEIVESDVKASLYDASISSIASAITRYATDEKALLDASVKSLEYAHQSDLATSNAELLGLYEQCIATC